MAFKRMNSVLVGLLLMASSGCTESGSATENDGDLDLITDFDPCEAIGNRPGVCPARGVFENDVEVEIDSAVQGDVYYTIDGSTPTTNSTRLDTDKLVLGASEKPATVLKLAVYNNGQKEFESTHSYVFSDALYNQSSAFSDMPEIWGTTEFRDSDYEMDARVLGQASKAEFEAALRSLPVIFVNSEHDDIWGQSGIYMNPEDEGLTVQTQFEYAEPGGLSLQSGAGLRIQGGSSQNNWKSAKLSMRVLFKDEFGNDKLQGRLFEDSETKSFKTLVLDAHLNHAYTHPSHDQRIRAQFLRDRFVADTQIEAGGPSPHGRFTHLFFNGLYWGMYELHERPDEHFASRTFGGSNDDWNVIKHRPETVINGVGDSYLSLFENARNLAGNPALIGEIQNQLDFTQFAKYMLVNFVLGNMDWPHHNWYGADSPVVEKKWHYFSWDAEHAMKGVEDNNFEFDAEGSPGELFQLLKDSSEFDAIWQQEKNALLGAGNVFDPIALAERYRVLADQIESAILLESARWGDNQRPEEPYLPSDWIVERDWILNDYFGPRLDFVLSELP